MESNFGLRQDSAQVCQSTITGGSSKCFDKQDRLTNYCFDVNLLLLIKLLNGKFSNEQCQLLFNVLYEQLHFESETTKKSIERSLSNSQKEYNNKNYQQAEIILHNLFRELNPLDLQKVIYQISESVDSSTFIKGKQIVMILGNTGAGKSTFIHFLAGSTITEVQNEEGLYHWETSKPIYETLQRVISKADAKSETKFVIPVTINTRDQAENQYGEEDKYIICDTPGFNDTEGKESDIANLTGITKCISVCKSIIPVVIISEKQISDKGQGIKSLAKVIKRMVKTSQNFNDVIGKFLFVFSKYSQQKDRTQLNGMLKNIFQNLNTEEQKDKELQGVLSTMINQTENQDTIAFFDLKLKGFEFLQTYIKQKQPIRNPNDFFTYFLTDEAQVSISEQLKQDQSRIQAALKKQNYVLINQKLNQLSILKNQIQDLSQINKQWEINMQLIDEYIQSEIQEVDQFVTQTINSNQIEEDRIEKFLNTKHEASKIIILKEILPQAENLFKSQKVALERAITGILENVKKEQISYQQNSLNGYYQKMLVLSKFQKNEDIIKKFISIVTEIIEKQLKRSQESLEKQEFENFFNELQLILNYIDSCQFNEVLNIKDTIEKSLQELGKPILKLKWEILEAIIKHQKQPDQQQQNQKISIKNNHDKIQQIQKQFKRSKLYNKEIKVIIDSYYQDYKKEIIDQYNQKENRVKQDLSGQHRELYELQSQVELLSTISEFFQELGQNFMNLMSSINQRMANIGQRINEIIKNVRCKSDDTDLDVKFQDIEQALQIIEKCQWIYKLGYENEYECPKEKIFKSLRNLASLIAGKLELVEITLDQTQDMSQITQFNQKMNKLKFFSNQDEKLKKIIEEYEQEVWNIFESNFENIKDFIDNKEVVYWKYEKYYLFLGECNKNKIYKNETQYCKGNLDNKIQSYVQQKQQKLSTAFNTLRDIIQKSSLTEEQDREKVQECSKQVQEIFEDMQKIKIFSQKQSHLKSIEMEYQIQSFSDTLKQLYDNIYQAVERSVPVEQKWIFILQSLKYLDEFQQNPPNQNKFSSLLSECYSKNKLNIKNLIKGFEQGLNDKCAFQMCKKYKQLQQQADQDKNNMENQYILNNLKQLIQSEMNKIKMEIFQYSDELRQIITFSPISSQFKEFIDNSSKIVYKYDLLKDYHQQFQGNLDLEMQKDTFERIKKGIKEIAQEVPQQISKTFENYNFKESHDLCNFMLKIFKNLQQGFDINEQYQQLNKIQENCFKKLEIKVLNLKLQDPISEKFDLNFVCGKLKEVGDQHYNGFSNKLKDIYKKKIQEILNQAQKKTLIQQEQIIEQVEQFFEYIPSEIQNSLKKDIKKMNNSSSTQSQIKDLFNKKNIQGLKKLGEELKNSSQQKYFEESFENFIKKEVKSICQSIKNVLQTKQFNKFGMKIQELVKIACQSPKQYQKLSKEQLNNIFEQDVCQKFNEFENYIQIILNKQNNQTKQINFQDYCQLNVSLINAKEKMLEDELKFLKEQEYFFIFDSICKQKEQVLKNIQEKVNLIQKCQDFKNIRIQFQIIHQLQSFDQNTYNELNELLIKKIEQFQLSSKQVLDKKVTEFKIQKEYQEYYENYQMYLQNSNEMQILVKQFNLLPQNINLYEDLKNKLQDIILKMNTNLEQCLSQNIFDENNVNSINNLYLNSKFIDQCCSQTNITFDQRQVENKFIEKIRQKFKEPNTEIHLCTEYISNMFRIYQTYIYFEQVKKECDENINQAIQRYKESGGSLEKLKIMLRQNKYGDLVTKNHATFKGFQIHDTNVRIQRFGIKEVLDQIKGYSGIDNKSDIDQKQLSNYYQSFLDMYNQYLENYLTLFEKIDFINLQREIQKSVKQLEFNDNGKIKQIALGAVSDLLAGIFACWTCINSKYYFESKTQQYEDIQSFLMKPHPAQLITIFRLLGIGYTTKYDSVQPNILAQVLTGEGKSVILAALSCFYALCGFNVKCACYSNQLSTRDYEDFLPLFEKLQIKDSIFYGTFNKVCEQILNDRGDIRQQISNFIQSGQISFKDGSTQAKQVLLIDEVDVFFSKEFFGNNYDVVAPIQDETIELLLDKIWDNKSNSNFSFNSISQSDQYKNCIAKFPEWKELIEEQTRIVIQDFRNFNSVILENYKIQNDKICYKNQDQYVDNISFGYRTLYTYYLEKQNSKISDSGLKQQKMFKINSGSFSYSELPKKFLMIKGVTGTLATLNESQKQLIQKSYNLNQYTFIPSVYGSNKFQFYKERDIKVADSQSDYFNNITNEINKRILGQNNQKRAVLVFFQTKEILVEYQSSDQFRGLTQNFKTQIITEENSLEERKKYIQEATYNSTITLMTRIFCRGIDFQVHDTILISNYGIHVIQTFFSEDKSEEIQAKGRTARQGEEGSYSMVLKQDTLQAFVKTEDEMKKINQLDIIYDIIDKNRNANFEQEFKSNLEYNQSTSVASHKQSETFLTFLKKSNQKEVKKYLLQLNQGPKSVKVSKTLIALDATGSMSGTITQAKNIIQTTFEYIRDILQQKGYDPQCFQVMMSIFRSYNSRWDEIFQSSPWENNPDNLRSFLQTVKATTGTWPGESVEVSLWWANKQNEQNPISQLIILGDQPANTESEAKSKRENYFGQSYWDTTPLKGLSHYVPECEKLKDKKVPVHTFYLEKRAQSIYEDISKLTNGKSDYFDVKNPESSKILRDIFVEQILRDVGKNDGREDELVKAYKAKYS